MATSTGIICTKTSSNDLDTGCYERARERERERERDSCMQNLACEPVREKNDQQGRDVWQERESQQRR